MKRQLALILAVSGVIAASLTGPAASVHASPSPAGAASKIFTPTHINRTPTGSPLDGRHNVVQRRSEIISKRAAVSNTYDLGGLEQAVIHPGSINYRDAGGLWQAIDDTLIPDTRMGYAYVNRANRYSLEFPSDLSAAPVRFTTRDGWVELSLIGARGPAAVSNNSARFQNALPGVDLAYTAGNDQAKETLSLQNSAAAKQFTYQLTVSPGLSPNAATGGRIDFSNSQRALAFSFAAPYMYDASNGSTALSRAISVKLEQNAAGWLLTVTPDAAWLGQPSRVWPVVIDPTVVLTGSDCEMLSGVPNTSYCGLSNINVGFDGTYKDRALVNIRPEAVLGNNVQVRSASLQMYDYNNSTANAAPVGLYQVTQAWDGSATWNNAKSGQAWGTAGGSFATPAAATNNSVGGSTGWYYWYPTQLVQNWINGTAADYGMLLKESNENVNNVIQFYSSYYTNSAYWPQLSVTYDPGLGEQSFYKFENHKLNDRMHLHVNLANGNLVLHANDFSIRGTGLNLRFDRYFNSLSDVTWDFAMKWTVSTGWDVFLLPQSDGTVRYAAPSGFQTLFTPNGGGYNAPAGLVATLVKNGDGSYKLTFNQTSEKYNFSSGGTLTSDVDKNGNTISFAYNGSGWLSSITDTQGRVTTFSYTNPTYSNLVTQIQDPAGRLYKYAYTGTDLTSYTDPNTGVTTYSYDGGHNLMQIKDPKGNFTNIGYDGSGRVHTITYVTDPVGQTGPTTTFTYNAGNPGNTVVADANNNSTTYTLDTQNQIRVAKVTDALGHPRQISYNPNAQVASLTDSLSAVTQLNYDTNNNLSSIQSPSSAQGQTPATTSFSYRAPGQTYQPSSATDAQGNCRAFSYDSSGNLQDVYDGQSAPCDGATGGSHSSNAYQGNTGVNCGAKNGELCWTTDPKGNRTTYGYDANGNVTSITPPAPLGATAISYDGISRVSTVTNGNNNRTSYSYDALDRIVQILYAGATTCVPNSATCTSYTYDLNGNLTNRGDITGNYQFSYDALNRLTDEALPDATVACTGSVPAGLTFAYDAVGNLTSYCDNNGTTTYRYDAANRLQNLAEPTGSCTAPVTLCTTFAYDNNDRRTQTTLPGGATLAAAYNTPGQQTSAIGKTSSGTVLTSFSYGYASSSRDAQLRQSMTEADPVANLTTSYTYDAMNRLLTAANPSTTLNYSYDANGNRCSTSTTCTSPTYQYNAANEVTASPGVGSYTYDGNGNETGSSAGDSFTYNAKNQTTALTHGGSTLSGLTYADADQTQRTAAGATSFVNSPLGVMIAKNGTSSTSYIRDNRGQVIGERTPDGSHWYVLKDGLGSVVAVISGDGSQIGARYAYDPYGQVTCKPTLSSCTVSNPWQFARRLPGLNRPLQIRYALLRPDTRPVDAARSGCRVDRQSSDRESLFVRWQRSD
jgi:YD repeat-containing protein